MKKRCFLSFVTLLLIIGTTKTIAQKQVSQQLEKQGKSMWILQQIKHIDGAEAHMQKLVHLLH